ncbi:MAG: accessory gene regulator B family protein [Lachnospiraceae bacterium]|nr:accessory gene regulator B family protein [Lachnospiraceae bacterium]
MFRYFAEDIAFILIKNKILDIENRDVYVYSIEAILLNSILLLSLLGISIVAKSLIFFIGFLLFFVPIRTFTGGYHAKHSETCFAMSVGVYVVSMFIFKYNSNLYKSVTAIILFGLAIIILLIWSPLKNPNHPLADYQYKRNRRIAYSIIIMYIVSFVVSLEKDYTIASSEVIFIVLVSVFLIIGKFEKQKQAFQDA